MMERGSISFQWIHHRATLEWGFLSSERLRGVVAGRGARHLFVPWPGHKFPITQGCNERAVWIFVHPPSHSHDTFLIYFLKKRFFPIIKNFENNWENSWYSFWCHGVFLMISIFYKPCSEGHLQGVPHLYLGLGEYIHVYFKYICIYGAKPFFWVQDTNWWPEAEWFVIISNYINYINFY